MSNGKRYFTLYPVKVTPELTGGVITNARATIDPSFNQPIVTMEMNNEGSREWARITGANINKRIAIVLDNAVFSAPVVRNKITGGHSQIEGMDNLDEARLLEIVLKAGALPAPVEIVEQRSVGPSLGEDSIRKGLLSSALATALTILFMVVYYRTGGAVADVALIFCLVFLLAVLAAFQGTLTLPGIAGIILTLAVAVDANVLIYERIREEIATGKTLRAAIDAGYEKAFTAIFDSNLTTFITGVILFQFGTGPVQGFALTLMIGIVVVMFSAIFITRVIFNVLTDRYGIATSISANDTLLERCSCVSSAKRTSISWAAEDLVHRLRDGDPRSAWSPSSSRGSTYGIDFLGGTELIVQFQEPVGIGDVRSAMDKIGLGEAEIKSFGSTRDILVRTVEQGEGSMPSATRSAPG